MKNHTNFPDIRIGQGIDAHKFAADRKLILGGIEFEGCTGLLGHSDADVCVHALMDALLSAAGLGDIGRLFPDSDVQYKDASSIKLLEKVCGAVAETGYRLLNADITVMCEEPKIAPKEAKMRSVLAESMQAIGGARCNLSIKGTTTEEMGFPGRREGILATAVCLLYRE